MPISAVEVLQKKLENIGNFEMICFLNITNIRFEDCSMKTGLKKLNIKLTI